MTGTLRGSPATRSPLGRRQFVGHVQDAEKGRDGGRDRGRFLVKTCADGDEERDAIVKRPRKKRHGPSPYWVWKFDDERN